MTAAVTLSVADNGNGNGNSTPSGITGPTGGNNSDIASANDTGPVAIITEDPTCAAQDPILQTLTGKQRNGWEKRDSLKPATEWTPEVRAQFEEVGTAMRAAADQLVPLAKLTPHRVMRELYEQFIAYARAYAESIPTYTAADEYLAGVSNSASSTISHVCGAIGNGSAAARGPLVPPTEQPLQMAPVGDPSDAQRFLDKPNRVCGDWNAALDQYGRDIAEWDKTDPAIPASHWTPEVKALNDSIAPVMSRFASRLQELGGESENPVLRDFADLSAQYRHAYVVAIPTYLPADQYLARVSSRSAALVGAACHAVEE
ncbi:hypothetical protein [Mycolicibacterium fortuitum]|uniref:hypothetical protein n=1 Tax=Mycolicibacterium fortuitum TaxID=1766 RepID=UPI0026334DDE|nr:hypothetical protein [Mycolicibacterium fortuitum]